MKNGEEGMSCSYTFCWLVHGTLELVLYSDDTIVRKYFANVCESSLYYKLQWKFQEERDCRVREQDRLWELGWLSVDTSQGGQDREQSSTSSITRFVREKILKTWNPSLLFNGDSTKCVNLQVHLQVEPNSIILAADSVTEVCTSLHRATALTM